LRSTSSTTERSAELPEKILVGLVHRAHGVRGEVLVEPLSDLATRFTPGSELALRSSRGEIRRLRIAACRPARTGLRVRFEGVETREAAEQLRGGELEVARAEVPPARAGEYYYFELLGCRAFDERLGELGEVVDLVEGAGGLLLILEDRDGRRLPVPFVEKFLIGVDPAARRIDWRLPEGLVEACASGS
jgi:16S rRNA processing protein RimM